MKVHCPHCKKLVSEDRLNLETGWAKCKKCYELFLIADVVAGFEPTHPHDPTIRPADARIVIEGQASKMLIDIPPFHPGIGGCLSFFMIIAAGALMMMLWLVWKEGLCGAFMAVPVSGFIAAYVGALIWEIWSTRSVQIEPSGITTLQQSFFRKRTHWIDIDKFRMIRTIYNDDESRPECVVLKYKGGSFKLPVNSRDEQRWLVAEINSFLDQIWNPPIS